MAKKKIAKEDVEEGFIGIAMYDGSGKLVESFNEIRAPYRLRRLVEKPEPKEEREIQWQLMLRLSALLGMMVEAGYSQSKAFSIMNRDFGSGTAFMCRDVVEMPDWLIFHQPRKLAFILGRTLFGEERKEWYSSVGGCVSINNESVNEFQEAIIKAVDYFSEYQKLDPHQALRVAEIRNDFKKARHLFLFENDENYAINYLFRMIMVGVTAGNSFRDMYEAAVVILPQRFRVAFETRISEAKDEFEEFSASHNHKETQGGEACPKKK